ncbi:catalase [Rhizohabitans arisaemae]|uniref:catalase n=1 Tax=Rhizohabitans arisaemae TaxID=2720610 RepID=UPI0024B0566D|nr:catalase [Rhizohabitans arisaemae]
MTSEERTAKDRRLDDYRVDPQDTVLTTDQGIRIDDTDNSLSAGERGPTLMEDFHFREKLTHFDHERIPERVVHARGAGAYGYYQAYDNSLADTTTAGFLIDPGIKTPVFVRFSTVAGSRGSADTVRDVRGFAVKFYTEQGNHDLVGNNFPVFFIQDGIKFPDFVHAVKPEPDNEIPQASSAHDTLWDFVQLQPETTHMMMWLMSDRAIPRSYRMMQGFGVHTFRLVNAEGRGTFVKFHWKPKLGTHSLVWDEAQKIAGRDPDFNRRDLWEAIEAGDFPEWELGLQLVPESDEFAFDFDLLDATKIIPEEIVPVRPVGRLILNRNPDNFFAETEQVAFHLGNVVPGIDFTNDPLLQARLFSYLDTQLIRLGGPNFPQIPVNRPIAEVRNNQRDGYHQMTIHRGQASYHPNSLGGGFPALADRDRYVHHQERVDGDKIRKRSESFGDHYRQATLFWNSMSEWERKHIVAAFRFELGKVRHNHIREGVVRNLNNVDHELAVLIASGIGVAPPEAPSVPNHGQSSPALSQAGSAKDSVLTRRIALLAADGVDADAITRLYGELVGAGATLDVLSTQGGTVRGGDGEHIPVTHPLPTTSSVVYDAVLVPGGEGGVQLLAEDGAAMHFMAEAYKHGKALGVLGSAMALLDIARIGSASDYPGDGGVSVEQGVVLGDTVSDDFVQEFIAAVTAHRHPERVIRHIPA